MTRCRRARSGPASGAPRFVLTLAALATLAACERDDARLEHESVPAGANPDVVRTTELQPGTLVSGARLRSPFEGSERAVQEGETFYTWFNCAGCHGALGGGGIGPPLRDDDWIYGGRADQIYMSILQGRPQGMPSFGGRIPDEVAWQIVEYVLSLGGGVARGDPSGDGGSDSPTEAEGGS